MIGLIIIEADTYEAVARKIAGIANIFFIPQMLGEWMGVSMRFGATSLHDASATARANATSRKRDIPSARKRAAPFSKGDNYRSLRSLLIGFGLGTLVQEYSLLQ